MKGFIGTACLVVGLMGVLGAFGQAENEIKDNISIEAYDPYVLGPKYCLKRMNDLHSDWHIYNLEHFLPGAPGPSKPNHQTVRAAKRAKLRAEPIETKEPTSD